MRKLLVTSALPYANGAIHAGHAFEICQVDIWVRFQQAQGHEVTYVCAEDAHGTAVSMRAAELGITPDELVEQTRTEHEHSYRALGASLAAFHTTHSEENQRLASMFYERANERGLIVKKTISQLFDPEAGVFLADRYVRGTCPKCGAEDQYGDNCEVCGAVYNVEDIHDPYSALSDAKPEWRESEHLFFNLEALRDILETWVEETDLQPAVRGKLNDWLKQGLSPWDITRDAPYFGFKVPGYDDRYFYVWMDAPIGYLAALQKSLQLEGKSDDLDEYLRADSEVEMYHFIGKDVMYFHYLFWPALLGGVGFRTPTNVFSHGFLTIEGQKMSKSRGTSIYIDDILKHLDADAMRYYFATRMGPSVDDVDLNFSSLYERVDGDLVGKLVNIAARCSGVYQRINDKGAQPIDQASSDILAQLQGERETLATSFAERDYAAATRNIMALCDTVNRHLTDTAPWKLAKNEPQRAAMLCEFGIQAYRILVTYLAPVVPELGRKSAEFLGVDPALLWSDLDKPLDISTVSRFQPLRKRLDVDSLKVLKGEDEPPETVEEPEETYISIDDFSKVELRVAQVITCESVEGARKLLRLKLDVGKLGERSVLSGISEAYRPEELEGKKVLLVANLAPRTMKFGTSEGMILAADGKKPQVIFAPEDAKPGSLVR